MRLIFFSLLASGLSCVAYAQDAPTASLEELRAGDAMGLADRLLPAGPSGDIESGTVRREYHLPGQAFDAIYTGRIRPGEGKTCVRSEYRVELHNEMADPNAERADPDVRLPVTKTSRYEKIALSDADNGVGCAPATGFVHASRQYPDRQLYEMRTLAEIIDIAGAGGIAPDQIDCTIGEAECDGVAILAAMDIGQLSAVRIASGRKRCDPAKGRVRTCDAKSAQEGEPFDIEATLAAGSGQMWKASWTAVNGEPLALTLRKSAIPVF